MTTAFEVTEELTREVEGHREKKYHRISDPRFSRDNQGRLLFIQHELKISGFHAGLVLACRRSNGAVHLPRWTQGPALNATVTALKTINGRDGREGNRDFVKIPLRPDALFTVGIKAADGHHRLLNYFYEADRMTMSKARMIEKFRAYMHCIRQEKQREIYGIEAVRAVLIDTLNAKHARTLCKLAKDPAVCGIGSPAPDLFWFAATGSGFGDTTKDAAASSRAFTLPEYIFSRIWSSSGREQKHSILDVD